MSRVNTEASAEVSTEVNPKVSTEASAEVNPEGEKRRRRRRKNKNREENRRRGKNWIPLATRLWGPPRFVKDVISPYTVSQSIIICSYKMGLQTYKFLFVNSDGDKKNIYIERVPVDFIVNDVVYTYDDVKNFKVSVVVNVDSRELSIINSCTRTIKSKKIVNFNEIFNLNIYSN
jgi:hypothetical protein